MAKLSCTRHGSNIYGSYKSGYWREQCPWHIQLELWSRIVRMDKNCSSGEENKNEKGILVVGVQCGKQGQWICVQIVCRSLRAQGREGKRCTGDTKDFTWHVERRIMISSLKWQSSASKMVIGVSSGSIYFGGRGSLLKVERLLNSDFIFFNTSSSELIPLSTASSPWRKVRTWIWLFCLHISKYCS